MKEHRLTANAKTAIRSHMKGIFSIAALAAASLGLTGCVQVAAPDKPIVINLNIKIEQEVIYRIEGAVKDAIKENADIFE
jgi:hypothetical protein